MSMFSDLDIELKEASSGELEMYLLCDEYGDADIDDESLLYKHRQNPEVRSAICRELGHREEDAYANEATL